MIRVGVIGAGYWGPNIIRNFTSHPETQVLAVCDVREERLHRVRSIYPHVEVTVHADELMNRTDLDLIAICTPVSTHYKLAKQALESGKHVFVEKPMTSSSAEALELIRLAREKDLHIFVDHTFLFTPAVQKIRHLLQQEEIGDLLYFDSVRINLGLFQHDASVVWDLAVHDFSILLYLIQRIPSRISATGSAHFSPHIHDMAYISLQYNQNFLAHFHVNWLSPVKVRKIFIAGSKKMIVWDDTVADEKIKIYDKGVDILADSNQIYDLLIQYRSGDMVSPQLPNREALWEEVDHIVRVLKGKEQPVSDGYLGYQVVYLLEITTASILSGGQPVKVLLKDASALEK